MHIIFYPQQDSSPELREQILALEDRAWPSLRGAPWPQREHRVSLCGKENGLLIAHAAVAAAALSYKGQSYRAFGLCEVVVAPEYRGRGLALALIAAARETMQREGADLCVLTCEPELCGLYTRAGGRQMDRLSVCGGTAPGALHSDSLGLCTLLSLFSPKAVSHQSDFACGELILPLEEGDLW